jgi:hypothetical protein
MASTGRAVSDDAFIGIDRDTTPVGHGVRSQSIAVGDPPKLTYQLHQL